MTRKPLPFAKPALALLSLFLAAMLVEAALRVVFYRSEDTAIEMWKYATSLKRSVADPALSFAHVPGARARLMGADVEINSRGLRDREYPLAKPPGVKRIMLLGDSTTFGWGLPLEQTSAKFLERGLAEAGGSTGQKFEVINAGVGNYDTVQEVEYYRTQGRLFHPDLVILVFFINDPEPVPRERMGFLTGRSYAAAFVASRFDALLRRVGLRPSYREYYSSLYGSGKPGFKDCAAALKSLAVLTRENGAGLVVAILPELRRINGDSYPFKSEHRMIMSLLASRGIRALDLIEGLKDRGPETELWITAGDDHPSPKANALIAAQIRAWLSKESGFPSLHPASSDGAAIPRESGAKPRETLWRP